MNQNGRKIRVQVRVSLRSEPPVPGALFLSCRRGRLESPETVVEMLEAMDTFLPFERRSDGFTILLHRRSLNWVSLERDEGMEELLGPPCDGIVREELVQVRFADGQSVGGLMALEISDEKKRASDFLNGSRVFFRLVSPKGLFLINKHAVKDVIVFETSPIPDLPLEDLSTA